MNPNTPVLVGAAQLLQRIDNPEDALEPVDMMVEVSKQAAEDTGNPGLLGQLESVRVIRGIWRYKNPAAYVKEALGSPGAETYGSPFGGNSVQSMVNRTALDILAGDRSLVLITGAEHGNTQAKARKAGVELTYKETAGEYDAMLGSEAPMAGEGEIARGIRSPIQIYPIFENAIRYDRGESIDDHLRRISELYERFSAVAVRNPNAWIRDKKDALTIRTPSPQNRMVSFPYPKLMNSNNAVDMAAALIMCSVEKARALGIPEDKWVYPWTGTDAHDHYYLSERDNLHSSPAIRIAGQRALALANLTPGDMDYVDIYSCFPSAVQVGASEIGFDEGRELTITGGLTYGGGPLNNYVMHSIARMVELARENPGSRVMITANGGYLTKHAFGIYSSEPPAKDFQHADVQSEVDALTKREGLIDFNGEVMVESYTVMYGADGPAIGHAACLTADGKRTWANTEDKEVCLAMTQEEFCGRRATIDGAGNLTVL